MPRRPRPSRQPAAYPKVITENDRPAEEPALSPAFHQRNLSHLIGRRTGGGIWPDDPEDAEAVASFEAGQHALYENKDAVAAIRAYEAALDRDPAYLKAWVALAIAYISDNTADSLERAEGVLERLAALEPNAWLTREASSIVHQNLAYLHLHRYRSEAGEPGAESPHLRRADSEYQIADGLAEGPARIELLCPWAYVKMELGQPEAARTLWERAVARVEAAGTRTLLTEYAAKYTPLRRFLKEN